MIENGGSLIKGRSYDPIKAELIRGRLDSIKDEMAEVMMATSGSPAQTEAMDFAITLFDYKNEIISVAALMTNHATATEIFIRNIFRTHKLEAIEDGDMFIGNDPLNSGAMHPNDTVIGKPIFNEKGEIIFWCMTEGHLIDVGGLCPGSWSVGTYDCFGEGLRIPPVKIIKKGEWDQDLVDMILNHTRTPAMYMGDIRAFVASNNRGEARLKSLIADYGIDTLKYYCDVIKDLSEMAMIEKIRKIPNGHYYNSDWQQGNGLEDVSLRIPLDVEVKDEEIIFDFTKAAPQTRGYINGTVTTTWSFTRCCVVLTLGYDIPLNTGLWRPFKFLTTPGTICDAVPPAGVSGAHMDGGVRTARDSEYCLANAMLMSEDPAIRSRVEAPSSECWDAVTTTGLNQYKAGYVEVNMDGGMTGSPAETMQDGFPGAGGTCQVNNKLPDVEWNEHKNPFIYLWKRILPDSGSPGAMRGGHTAEIAWIPWQTELISGTLNAAIRDLPTRGVTGSYPAFGGRFLLIKDSNAKKLLKEGIIPTMGDLTGDNEILPGKVTNLDIDPTCVFIHACNGSGGIGDPLERELWRIEDDYLRGLLSEKVAKLAYGAIIEPSTGKVDAKATEKERQKIRKARLARSKLAHPKGGKLEGAKKIRPINWYLDFVEKDGQRYIMCNRCNQIICKKGQQWKEFAATCIREVSEAMEKTLGMWTGKRRNPPLTNMVEYYCPGCGQCLTVDVITADIIDEKPLPIREEPAFLFKE